jgi:hypothetical protein
MSAAVLLVNVVLAAFVFAAVVGFLASSITHGQEASVRRARVRQARTGVSSTDEQVGRDYSADRGLVVG